MYKHNERYFEHVMFNLVARARDPLCEECMVGLWEKAQKNVRNSLHITIGSSTLGKRAIDDGALQGVENDITRKNYVPSSFIRTLARVLKC